MTRAPLINDPRYDRHGAFFFMGAIDGHVMCRRKGCGPIVKSAKEWAKMEADPWSEAKIVEFDAAEEIRRGQMNAFIRHLTGGRR